jgi:hypothetical protein
MIAAVVAEIHSSAWVVRTEVRFAIGHAAADGGSIGIAIIPIVGIIISICIGIVGIPADRPEC